MQSVEQKKEERALPPQAQNITKNPIPSRGMILPITGGLSADFENKKQRKSYFKRVHAILPEGRPVVKTNWSHIPITFTEQDLKLQCYPQNDAMVIEANVAG